MMWGALRAVRPHPRGAALLACVAILLAPSGSSAAAVPPDSAAHARIYMRWAREMMADSTFEGRQRAIRNLRDAIRFDPTNHEPWMILGQVYERGAFAQLARESYRNAIALAPRDADAYMALAMAWKREWIATLDSTAFARAQAAFDTVLLLRPRASEPWLRLVPMRYEHRDLDGAAAAAARAVAGWPRRPQALLAVAYIAYRLGDIERADSAFTTAIPRLDATLQVLFHKPGWIGLEPGGAPGEPRHAGDDAWAGLDPDPTTPQNEMKLEYWSRVAHAYFLFFDPLQPELDARAVTYVRFGPPANVALNPLGTANTFQYKNQYATRRGSESMLMEYPLNALVWSYPDYGMRVVLHDRALNGTYTPAATRDFDPQSVPDRGRIAQRGDLALLGDGLAVFPTLPPRDQRLDLKGIVARFEGTRQPRLVAQVQAPGAPGDTMWARWVVLDSTGSEVSRASRPLAVSACDPGAARIAEFSADLPPGAFDVAVSVRDNRRRRGLYRVPATLAAHAPGLALSDVLLSCGAPSALAGGTSVRLEANIEGKVRGRGPLVAYFEIYRLAPGDDRLARFQYEYAIRRDRTKPGEPDAPLLTAVSREETHAGDMRRQFVSVPIESLPPGRYRLEIRVRDLVSGTEARGLTRFERE